MQVSQRSQAIHAFHVMDILAQAKALAAQGKDIIHMEVGEPDFATPEPIIQAANKALQITKMHYTPALGLPELRQKLSNFYQNFYHTSVKAENIIITSGASAALLLVLGSILDPGDKVMLADPGYPCNRHFVRFLEGKTHAIAVNADTQYQLNRTLIEQHWDDNIQAVLLASPANPTGTLISKEEIQKILQWLESKDKYLIVDEIYQGLVYDLDAYTALSLSSQIIVINSFSKFFQMTGWRVGWTVVPPHLIDAIDRLAQNIYLAPPTLAQYAALAALDEETLYLLEQRRQIFQQRRNYLLLALQELGFDIPCVPQGAFYIYAKSTKFTQDSASFCQSILHNTHVAITPGKDFGNNENTKYVRFAYTQHLDRLQQGVERLRQFLIK